MNGTGDTGAAHRHRHHGGDHCGCMSPATTPATTMAPTPTQTTPVPVATTATPVPTGSTTTPARHPPATGPRPRLCRYQSATISRSPAEERTATYRPAQPS